MQHFPITCKLIVITFTPQYAPGFLNGNILQAIQQILVDTDLPINEVSATCGFASNSHFNAFFRKAVGVSPGEYRKQHRNS